MKIMTRRSLVASLFALVLIPWSSAGAATRESELQERFKERFPKIQALKTAGAVGETYLGYVETVDKKAVDKDATKLLEDENKDRKELFELLAKKEGVTAEKVAERYAKRAFEKAKTGENLKGADGKWKKKE